MDNIPAFCVCVGGVVRVWLAIFLDFDGCRRVFHINTITQSDNSNNNNNFMRSENSTQLFNVENKPAMANDIFRECSGYGATHIT